MDSWFDRNVRDLVYKAVKDELADLKPGGSPLLSSPLIQVIAADDIANTATLELRGRIPLFHGTLSPFVHLEMVVSRVAPPNLMPPVQILGWNTVVGDLRYEKGLFLGELGFGWERDHWLGRGTLRLETPPFGLDILLGGLNERGLMLGISLNLPAPIPLGPTGVALTGVGGDFAYDFHPDLSLGGPPPTDPIAVQYVRWARDHELDNWKSAAPEVTAVGLGIHAGLGDVTTGGFLFKLDPIGFLVLIPGPVVVLGGKGKLLSTESIRAEGYLVVDIPSGSLALGLGAAVAYPPPPVKPYLIDAHGQLNAYFSFAEPSAWYVHLGTKADPITIKVFELLDADAYFTIDSGGAAFGAGISIGGDWDLKIIEIIAKAGARADVQLGWDPVQLEGMFKLWGELGIKIWEFELKIEADASATGRVPHPFQLKFDVHYKLDLPWPLPDPEGTAGLTIGDDPAPPPLAQPLRSTSEVAATDRLRIGGLHELTGRQWELAGTPQPDPVSNPWPDTSIVIPFNQPVRETTGTVINGISGSPIRGGYEVTHTITKLELVNDTEGGKRVDVRGVWAAGPNGTSGRLHLLGTDPFAWLSPHSYPVKSRWLDPARTVEQTFGTGPDETARSPVRFGHLVVDPDPMMSFVSAFQPALNTRVLRTESVVLSFSTGAGAPVPVDRMTLLLLVGPSDVIPGSPFVPLVRVTTSAGALGQAHDLGQVYGDVHLVAADVLVGLTDRVEIRTTSAGVPFHLYAVRYREAEELRTITGTRTLLKPAKYTLTMEGSTGGQPAGASELPAGPLPDGFAWSQTQSFWVQNPESLRPYVCTTTIGDPRLFGRDAAAWNPTPFGVGFPAYRRYRPAIRFLVPYMTGIYSPIRTRLRLLDGTEISQDLAPTSASDGICSLPQASQDWITTHGGWPATDEELLVTDVIVKSGAAAVSLSFVRPDDGQEIKLDEWAAHISRFERFTDHVAWLLQCVTVFHTPFGTVTRAACPMPSEAGSDLWRWLVVASEARALASGSGSREAEGRFRDREIRERVSGQDQDEGPRSEGSVWDRPDWLVRYPDELSSPPLDWVLPSSLTEEVAALDANSGYRYARFAAATGMDLSQAGDPLSSVGDMVDRTSVEAVVDGTGRPVALWLRTPEPIDWRRVSVSLRIRHVNGGPCPDSLAHRRPLDLQILLVPSPDASAAFLVGSQEGVLTRLPRGVYELTLAFDPAAAGLTVLRPDPEVGPVPEHMVLRFVQPSGADWPLPADHIPIPHRLLELLRERFGIDPGPLHELLEEAVAGQEAERMAALRAVDRAAETARRIVEAGGPGVGGSRPGPGEVGGGSR